MILDLHATTATTGPRPGPHHLAIVLDAGPRLVMFLVDGVLCDGGVAQTRGWAWVEKLSGDLNQRPGAKGAELLVGNGYGGDVLGGRIYSRALRNSEVIGNFRAGPAKAY